MDDYHLMGQTIKKSRRNVDVTESSGAKEIYWVLNVTTFSLLVASAASPRQILRPQFIPKLFLYVNTCFIGLNEVDGRGSPD